MSPSLCPLRPTVPLNGSGCQCHPLGSRQKGLASEDINKAHTDDLAQTVQPATVHNACRALRHKDDLAHVVQPTTVHNACMALRPHRSWAACQPTSNLGNSHFGRPRCTCTYKWCYGTCVHKSPARWSGIVCDFGNGTIIWTYLQHARGRSVPVGTTLGVKTDRVCTCRTLF